MTTTTSEEDRHVFMFYSKSAERSSGSFTASVPDGNGDKKEVIYTDMVGDPKDCIWRDKELVWEGKVSEQKFIGHRPKRP